MFSINIAMIENPRRLREINNELVAVAYTKFLLSIDWNDSLLKSGLREGLNKFLSNAFLSLDKRGKYLQGDFYSKSALEKVHRSDFSDLIYEHIVPKRKYIQGPCEEMASQGRLDVCFSKNLIDKYYKIAIITSTEDAALNRFRMPHDWDGEDIFSRYKLIGLELFPSDF